MLKKESLGEFEDHPEKIMLYAKAEYARTNMKFRVAANQQEQKYKKEIDDLWASYLKEGQN